ncbi:organic anion transporter 3-like [Amblyomma americanum]
MPPKEEGGSDAEVKSPTLSLLEGFMSADSRALIQENVYVILGHGRFQHSVLVFTTLTVIVLLIHAFAYRLIGRPVDHWCQPPSEFRDWPVEQWRNVAIPVLADGSFSRCTVYSPPVPDDNLEERREVACNRWDYNATDVGDSVVSMWDLVCEHQWLYSISSSVYIMGPLCLVPVAGKMADRVGRKPVILVSAATMLLASMAASTTKALGAFLMARFVISAATSVTNVLNFIVLYEVTGNEHRALYILLANIVGTTVPPVLYSLLSLLRPSWRLSHALFVAASAIVLACCYSLEESPVWQLATWRIRQAESTVLHVAKYNGVDGAKARATFRALKRQLEKRETASAAGTDQRLLALNVVMTVLSLVSAVAVQWLPEIFSHQNKDPDPSPLDAEHRIGTLGGMMPLRVVDASCIPYLVSGNLSVPLTTTAQRTDAIAIEGDD